MKIFLMAILGMVLVGASAGGGQLPTPSQQQQDLGMPGRRNRELADALHTQQMARMRNEDRQKRLVTDADKLLALATDLKVQVDQSTTESLSVDTLKKIDEIEKLAHSVKERMKG
jgi:hypothetical protein